MTMPHLMNCPHSNDAHCLDCVKKEWENKEAEIVALRKAVEVAAKLQVVMWTSNSFVRQTDALSEARRNDIFRQALDAARANSIAAAAIKAAKKGSQ